MKSFRMLTAASAVFVWQFLPMPALAVGEHDSHHADEPTTSRTAGDAARMTDGEVRKVDKDAKKITLKHGEIRNLEMPAMTMVFQVKDGTLLDKVKVGDKVKFTAEKIGGGYAVSEIEVAK